MLIPQQSCVFTAGFGVCAYQQASERLEDDKVWRDEDCSWSLLQGDTAAAQRETHASENNSTVLNEWLNVKGS